LLYRPGVIINGENLKFDCGSDRSISWFMEPLIIMALFGKEILSIDLEGFNRFIRNH
jgi:RNA 3'-terminal phosphate cyclase-like protein